MKLQYLVIIFSVVFSLIPIAFACECVSMTDDDDYYDYNKIIEDSHSVFIGTIHDVDPGKEPNEKLVYFDVLYGVKGNFTDSRYVMTQNLGTCDEEYKISTAHSVVINDSGNAQVCSTVPITSLDNVENLPVEYSQPLCGARTELVDGQCVPIQLETKVHRDCLIATASYGSNLAPQVQMLREIRDNTLLNTESGKIFMGGFNTVYYSFSPQVAQLENDSPIFKETVKLFITPMITTLSIMTLAQEDSEFDVLFLGLSTIGLIVGMYIVAPITIICKIRKRKLGF